MAPSIIGRYEVLGELGKGAMGVVFRAKDPNIGRMVALKTMRLDVAGVGEEEMLKRFKHEAQLAGVMNHPNIVTIYDAGEDQGMFYIAMEFVEGKTIQQLLNLEHTLPPERVLKITRDVCAGLDHAHAAGIIHRDVKPPNLMLMSNGMVKIMDFGIAKSSATMTMAGQVLGTPSYMSPEQVKGKKLDGRSDLFSYGVCLYEMVTGERPFAGKNLTTIIYKIVNEQPTSPRDLDVSIHPGLSTIILKCLAKDPDERYQTGADLVKDLENFKALVSDESATTVIPQVDDSAKFAATVLKLDDIRDEPMDTMAFDSGKISQQIYQQELQATGKMQASESGGIPSVNTTSQLPAVKTGVHPAPVSTTASMPAAPAPPSKAESFEKTVYVPPKKTVVKHAPAPIKPVPKSGVNKWAIGGVIAVLLIMLAWWLMSGDEPKQVTFTIPQPPKINNALAAASKPAAPSTPPATGAAATPATAPAVTAPVAVTKPGKEPAKPITGQARVTSIPRGATVTVDGATDPAWITDFTAKDLKPGSHEFEFAKDGYVSQKLIQNIRAGETNSFTAILSLSGATLKISSDPVGASIFLDGKNSGQVTPSDIHVDAGSHKIVVRKPGFREENTTVEVKDGDTYPFSPTMESNKGGGRNNNNNNSAQVPPRLEQMMQRATQQGKGVLALITNPPGATISSNGQEWGKPSPFFGPLAPGTYHVTIIMQGYRSQQRDIVIEAGKFNSVNIKLNQ